MHLTLAHVVELALVAIGALAQVHVATARSRNAKASWFNGVLFGWTLSWSTWFALTFIQLNLETLDYGRVDGLSLFLDAVKGSLISLQAGLLLHGVAKWTGCQRVPSAAWYVLPAVYVVWGFVRLVASPSHSFLRNIDEMVVVFLLCDAFQTATAVLLLRRARGRLPSVSREVASSLESALLWSIPLLLGSAAAKWLQGAYRPGVYDWVLLFDLAHLLPPAALLYAAYRTGTVAMDVTRASLARAFAFTLPFSVYLVLKLAFPRSPLDRVLTFLAAGAGFLILLGPLPATALRAFSRAFDLERQRENDALDALDARLRRIPPRVDPVSYVARCLGRILSCRTGILDADHPSVAAILASSGRDRIATLGQASTREVLLAWEDIGGRILLPLRTSGRDAPHDRAIVLCASRKKARLPPALLARLSAALASLQAVLDARSELHSRLETERRLQEGERLAMLGLLSASTAHEIRNPLSAIRNIAHAARAEAPEGSTIRKDLEMVASEVDRLDATVRRMLHFARDRETCEDACATLSSTCGLLEQESRARGVHLDLRLPEVPVPVPMSENDLKATLFNLVLNALQHSPAGGRVDVRLAPEGPSLEIENDGEIPDDFRQNLFRPLASRGGTGLGLYICRKRAEEAGGRLVHEPLPGRTLFRLSWSAAS